MTEANTSPPHVRSEDDVVIVATGGVSPTGRDPEEAHRAAVEFRTGLRLLTPLDIEHFDVMACMKGLSTPEEKLAFFRNAWGDKCGVGGVIPAEYLPDPESGFYPTTFFKRGERLVGRSILQAYVALEQIRGKLQALFADEGRRIRADLAPETIMDIGCGMGCAMERVEREFAEFLHAENTPQLGMNYGKTKWLLGVLENMVAAQMAAQAGVQGGQSSSNAACASSGFSMLNGFNALQSRSADVAIVGGSEYATGAVVTLAFDAMMKKRGALTRNWRNDRRAEHALLAFGAGRDGFVPGDAAGLVVMMRRRVADLLGVEPLAWVRSVVANTCQSQMYDKNLADGTITGQAALLTRLFGKIGVEVADIRGRLVHFLHGTGTKVGAINELYAVAKALGDLALDGRYSGTGVKEREGHSLGAAMVANVIALIEAMRNRCVPGLPTTREVDPALRTADPQVIGREGITVDPRALNAVADGILCRRHQAFDPERDVGVVTAMGFGGSNVAVLLKSE